MADGILDYRLQSVISPMQAAMSGFQGIQQMALGRQQSLLLEAQKAAEAAQTAKVEQETKQAQESAAAVAALYDEIKGGTMRPESVFRVISANPALAQPLEDLKKGITGDQNRALFDLNNDLLTATELGDFERVNAGIDRQIAAYDNAGDQEKAGAARAMKQLLAADPAQFQTALSIRLASLDPDRFEKRTAAVQAFRSMPLAIEEARLANVKTETEIANLVETGKLTRAQAAQVRATTQSINRESAASNNPVQSSQILDDGTVVVVRRNGQTDVIGADGVPLQGEARVDAVRQAQQFGVSVQAQRAGAREMGTLGARAAGDASKALQLVRSSQTKIDEAIRLIDEGAKTGVIASRLPTWNASAIELRNLQNRLGLDVIGGTTFGALSEAELSMALQTALPTNLSGPQLRNWLQRQKAAQNKLIAYHSRQVQFLSVPGRTFGDWEAHVLSGGLLSPRAPVPGGRQID